MSYDLPRHETLHFAQVDFGGASSVTRVIAVPLDVNGIGMRGKVLGARVHNITENFAGTTDAGVQVGDGSDADKYFDSGLVLDENVDTGESVYLLDDGAQVDIEGGRATVTVTFVAATGTPTGIADVDINVAWW
jgi:hypothetical protein